MKKAGLFTAAAVVAVMLGGCGRTANNLGNATERYNNSIYGTGTYSSGGTAYWDGYGVNSGRTLMPNDTGRNTYGMRTNTANLRNGVNGNVRTNNGAVNNGMLDGRTAAMVD